MVDLNRYADDVILTTSEVAQWLGCKPATVLSIPGLRALEHLRRRHKHFRAGDVKRAILQDHRERSAGHELRIASGGRRS